MLMEYLGVELAVLSVALVLVLSFFRAFGIKKKYVLTMLFPMFIFTAGFSLRLTGVQKWIDMGFYLTDFTYVYIYILFTASFMLGQIKYWKKQ